MIAAGMTIIASIPMTIQPPQSKWREIRAVAVEARDFHPNFAGIVACRAALGFAGFYSETV